MRIQNREVLLMQFKKENSNEILKIRVTKTEKEAIRSLAKEKGLTLTELIKEALTLYFKKVK